jgi:uncharacterized BrkB/YihY/UPF0761 family membrane protein
MSAERPDDPLKSLWQSQETELPEMSVQVIRQRFEASQRQRRRGAVFGLAVTTFVAVMFAFRFQAAANAWLQAGALIVIVGAVLMAWWAGQRWPGREPKPDAPALQLLDYQRRALLQRRLSLPQVLGVASPILLGVVVMVIGLVVQAQGADPGLILARLSPIFGLLALWFVLLVVLHRRGMAKLQRELAELDALRRGE